MAVVAGGLASALAPAAGQVGGGAAGSAGKDGGTSDAPDVPPVHKPAIAGFEGRKIDLSSGWEEAKACVVLHQADVVECFRTAADAEAAIDSLKAEHVSSTAAYWCALPLRLYEHGSFTGRQVMFFDRGYVQNLPDFGFNDQVSSYQVGACPSYLNEHTDAAGAWYPGPSGPGSSVPSMFASWNDRVSSIYIA